MKTKIKNLFSKLKNFLKKKWKLSFAVVLIIAGMGIFFYRKARAEKVELVFEKPIKQNVTKILEVSGSVDAKERVQMRFSAGGKVVYLGAQEGERVKKWQTIATIDKRSLNKNLEKDLNLYLKERWDWDQQLDDIKDRTIDKEEQRDVDKNQLDLSNTVLDVEIQDIAITNTTLSSPFDGVLVDSPTNITGIWLLATDVFEIVNPSTLVFRALVDEADISQVKIGQKAKIYLDAYEDLELDGNVNKISYKSTASTSGTSFIVELKIIDPSTATENALEKYRLGMNGDVNIVLEEKNDVLTIPLVATREEDGKTYVDVKTGEETTEAKEVEVGLETDDVVEILSGLDENEEVLIPQI